MKTWLQKYLESRYGSHVVCVVDYSHDASDDHVLIVTGPEFQFDN